MLCQGFPQEDYILFALGVETVNQDGIREHLGSACVVCQKQLFDSQALIYGIAQSAPPRIPSAALRRRIVNAVSPQPVSAGQWLWPAWAGVATLALAGVSGFFFTRPTSRQVEVRTVTLPSPVPVSVQVLEQENQRLKAELDARLLTPPKPAPSRPAAKPNSPPPAADQPNPLRAPLDQALQSASDEHARSAQLEADLAQQKALVASSQRDLQEANQKYLAASIPASSDDLQKQLAALTSRSAELERQVAQYKLLLANEHARLESTLQLASLLSSPDLTLVRLRNGSPGNISAEGHALVRAGSQVVFYASDLPALPAGRTYQLWLIRAQTPAIVSAGIFSPNAQKRAVVQFSSAPFTSGITAIAVTDEPAGGSKTPTGHKLLVGQTASAA